MSASELIVAKARVVHDPRVSGSHAFSGELIDVDHAEQSYQSLYQSNPAAPGLITSSPQLEFVATPTSGWVDLSRSFIRMQCKTVLGAAATAPTAYNSKARP